MRRWLKTFFLVIVLLVVVAAGGFVIWGSSPLPAMPEAEAALVTDGQVRVQSGKWLVFEPASVQAITGLVFYPGGRVDPAAYAPAAHALAASGFTVVIVPMPLNLAVLNAGAAEDVIAAYPGIQHWAVGGHSLGGAMAANFAAKNPGAVQGLVLWAAYPAGSDDLSASGIQVVSVYAELDGLASRDQIEASRALLPPGTAWVSIQGGNHAGFGWYGDQPGDKPATITRQDQQRQVVEATRQLLQNLP